MTESIKLKLIYGTDDVLRKSNCYSQCKYDIACCGVGNALEMPLVPCHVTAQFSHHLSLF